ncbi:hypothetical protein [Nonomuraea sp. NPDC049141]|uniref:hypothetical protein n=1 Tax=Nonomuraea sp. NPDC049141 TaxID=3155500 RepID=UPI0033F1B85A
MDEAVAEVFSCGNAKKAPARPLWASTGLRSAPEGMLRQALHDDDLRDKILNGTYPPGSVPPSSHELRERYLISEDNRLVNPNPPKWQNNSCKTYPLRDGWRRIVVLSTSDRQAIKPREVKRERNGLHTGEEQLMHGKRRLVLFGPALLAALALPSAVSHTSTAPSSAQVKQQASGGAEEHAIRWQRGPKVRCASPVMPARLSLPKCEDVKNKKVVGGLCYSGKICKETKKNGDIAYSGSGNLHACPPEEPKPGKIRPRPDIEKKTPRPR